LVFPPVTSQLPESSRESCPPHLLPALRHYDDWLGRLKRLQFVERNGTCFHWPISCSPFLNFIVSAIPRTLRSAVNVIKHGAIFIGTSQKSV
jgi:hypothetical protein